MTIHRFLWVALAAVTATPALAVEGSPPGKDPAGYLELTIAMMRVMPKPWDKAHNFALLQEYAQDAAQQGASLVMTCEGFLDGYVSNPSYVPDVTRERLLDVAEPLDGPWLKKIATLADQLEVHIAVGFAERRGEQALNSMVLFDPGGQTALHYSKMHTKGEPFTAMGDALPVATTGLGKVGALICYDRHFPEVPRILALKGAEILLIPAYGNDSERNEALLRTRAWENSVWIFYVRQNQALAINPSGKIVARDKGSGDELVIIRVALGEERGSGSIHARRSPEVYRELIGQP
jgi:predicted amidohydrolase